MTSFIFRRFIILIPTVLALSVFVFILMQIAPGDPTYLYTGPQVSKEVYERTREFLGLDQPLYIQFWKFLTNLSKGNLGRSLAYRTDVIDLLKLRLPNTLLLGGAALITTYIIAIPFGTFAAINRGKLFDSIILFFIAIGMAVPTFWMGLMLILLFSVSLRLLPVSGYDSIRHMILPVLTITLVQMSFVMRMMRSSMLEVLHEDYVRTARAKGVKENVVIFKHALRNALVSVISVMGMQIGWLVGGSVVIETVFVWPGVGRLLVDSILRNDYPLTQGVLLVIGISVILGNLLADILYRVADPRITL